MMELGRVFLHCSGLKFNFDIIHPIVLGIQITQEVYTQYPVQHNLIYYILKQATCFGIHDSILRPSIVSRDNRRSEDGVMNAETCCLFEYVIN
jgi:hypothetical protein